MNINEALIRGYDILKSVGIESYIIDTQLLLCKVLKVNKLYIIMNRNESLSEECEEEFLELINTRKERCPIAYILGQVEFMGINLYVKDGVLIPRPDTEILVEQCISIINDGKLDNICDMCCGSGAIGVAIAKYTEAKSVTLFDISPIAYQVTSENIHSLKLQDRVKVIESNLFAKAKENELRFNMIVSNPPYIREDILPTLMNDVKDYEPHLALSGGDDGLEFYRAICEEGKELLDSNGYLCFEIGHDQEVEVKTIMEDQGFQEIYSLKDLGGNYRVVIGKLP
ncbi:MAG: peptide chain release factor N(5)-glutamine methyltransferase [Clostridium sp.]|uniref:peptide chain release factor N(5)-glutamine methyltransferase n=1 Tax=Clostridium sp. TaxID=1506 RepID=UPI00303996A8